MALLRPRLALRIYLVGLAQFAVVLLGFALLMWMNRTMARKLESDAHAALERIIASLGDSAALDRELAQLEGELDATIIIYDDEGRVVAANRGRGHEDPAVMAHPPLAFGARTKVLALPPFSGALPPPPPLPGAAHPLSVFPGGPLAPPPFAGGLPDPPPFAGGLPAHPSFGGGLRARGFGAAPLLPPDRPPMLAFVTPVQLPAGQTGRIFFAAKNVMPPANGYMVIGLVLVVVGLASFFTARSLAKPLTRLSTAAQRFGAGELETRVRLQRDDEVGEVAHAFDEMAERITNLVSAEKELIANVSHELRTPLARIRVALDLAAEGDAQVARQLLTEIADDLGELEQLISDVLVASRLDLARLSLSTASAVLPLHEERVEVFDLLERAAARFRSAHPDRRLELGTQRNGAAVKGDAVLLRRALQNLLENAHKYTSRPGASIIVHAGADASRLWIDVRDEGIGIAPDDLRHVFRPFFRADKSRTRATGGVGLGLALVKQIAEAHRGSVEIESQIGKGTRVRIWLPMV